MNANQLIKMVLRQITRRLVNGGIDAGMNAFSNRKKAAQEPEQDGPWAQAGKPGKKKQQQSVPFNAKQAKQAMRVTRRMTKF